MREEPYKIRQAAVQRSRTGFVQEVGSKPFSSTTSTKPPEHLRPLRCRRCRDRINQDAGASNADLSLERVAHLREKLSRRLHERPVEGVHIAQVSIAGIKHGLPVQLVREQELCRQ